MKLLLEFEVEKNEMPLEYRRIFLSFLKQAISGINNGKYFEKYYKDTLQKDFTWAVSFKNPQFTKDKIKLENNCVRMSVSADESENTGYILFSAFVKMKNTKIPLANSNSMVLRTIKQQSQQDIICNSCLFTSYAPVIVREHNKETNKDRYYSIGDGEFEEKLLDSLKRQALTAGFMEEDADTIQVTPITGKKVVIKHYNIWIDGTIGELVIRANRSILKHFYLNGISGRRSEGFGYLELIAQEQI